MLAPHHGDPVVVETIIIEAASLASEETKTQHPTPTHAVSMAENRPFTIKIEPDADGERRYRWAIYESEMLRDHATKSYATIREAESDADKALRQRIKNWRIGK